MTFATSVALVAGLVASTATPAGAVDPADVGVCTVNGAVTLSGVDLTLRAATFNFVTVAIVCNANLGLTDEDGGPWNVSACGGTAVVKENTAFGLGQGVFSGVGGPDGAITNDSAGTCPAGAPPYVPPAGGVSFYYVRVGVLVLVAGTIGTAGDGALRHPFVSALAFVPTVGNGLSPLPLPPGNAPVTAATLTGVAVLADSPVALPLLPPLPPPVIPCPTPLPPTPPVCV
jgi:hypothetical protein